MDSSSTNRNAVFDHMVLFQPIGMQDSVVVKLQIWLEDQSNMK